MDLYTTRHDQHNTRWNLGAWKCCIWKKLQEWSQLKETDRNPFLLGEQQLTASWNSDIPQPLVFREMSLPSRHQLQMPRRCERKRNHHLCHPQHLRWSLSQPWRLKKSIGGCGWECLVWYSWEWWYHAVREKRWTIENGRLQNSKAVESECLYSARF